MPRKAKGINMIYQPDAELSATEVVSILLNPKDRSQVLWKRINQLANQIASNSVDREDLVSEGLTYCIEKIHEKWLQIPEEEGDAEPILTLSQMVRYLTSGMFLEKRMRIASQNLSTQIEIKDNYKLHLKQTQESEQLADAGLQQNMELEPSHTEEAFRKLCADAVGNGGMTASGNKLFEDSPEEAIIDKVSYEKSYKLFLPRLTEQEILLYEQIVKLDLSYDQIAAIEGDVLANSIAKRWERLKLKITGILLEYRRHPHRIPKQEPQMKPQPKAVTLIRTEIVKAAVKHGIFAQEVDQMLGLSK